MKADYLKLILFIGFSCATGNVLANDAQTNTSANADAVKTKAMQQYVIDLYTETQVVHRFIKNGETVSCVNIYSQPALRSSKTVGLSSAPMAALDLPPDDPIDDSDMKVNSLSTNTSSTSNGKEPAFVLTGGLDPMGNEMSCPKNSIPILMVTVEQIKRFNSINEFLQKVPSELISSSNASSSAASSYKHKYAHAYQNISNWGQEAIFNLWSPYTETAGEFSLSQTWVTRGTGKYLETLEAGWQNYKLKYGDYNSRLFIYFTPDNYGTGGCYNHDCGKFVQTNNAIVLGGKFSNYSSTNGNQYEITLRWQRDSVNGNWWLKYGDMWVGYYPSKLFDSNGLKNQASSVDWGGEILDAVDKAHTSTDMGSGAFPQLGYKKAAYTRNIRYLNTSNVWTKSKLTVSRTNAKCYDITVTPSTGSWGTYFYFGGSGYNSQCKSQ
ncbi:neprosin family prolyl endopeptidase [Thiothrix fructosivorans]|jgi:hypothetical protein|uniref:Neprosin family prolyl endopeptidase n=1 Tax=Thiothrix fructosivorans TaxID=111770 RepID=A0A8B0SQ15_9GAMM|nr:neprosin family prolyl endopeptidase [Thiothrix fructosivorans]MBO0612411.1 neprosin family prolyl endopeptidase [Thiothrix fructosivorans]QTX12108.1 neprosin family prolyl endopeptidase [Thiothrix fructosivorans]